MGFSYLIYSFSVSSDWRNAEFWRGLFIFLLKKEITLEDFLHCSTSTSHDHTSDWQKSYITEINLVSK